MYDLCKIVYFPFKSKEPTKLTHMSCFFCLKGLIWYLQLKLGLNGLIWSLGPKLNLQDFIKSMDPAHPSSSPCIRADPVSTSLSTFDKQRLRGYCVVLNCIRTQKPNLLYI